MIGAHLSRRASPQTVRGAGSLAPVAEVLLEGRYSSCVPRQAARQS